MRFRQHCDCVLERRLIYSRISISPGELPFIISFAYAHKKVNVKVLHLGFIDIILEMSFKIIWWVFQHKYT